MEGYTSGRPEVYRMLIILCAGLVLAAGATLQLAYEQTIGKPTRLTADFLGGSVGIAIAAFLMQGFHYHGKAVGLMTACVGFFVGVFAVDLGSSFPEERTAPRAGHLGGTRSGLGSTAEQLILDQPIGVISVSGQAQRQQVTQEQQVSGATVENTTGPTCSGCGATRCRRVRRRGLVHWLAGLAGFFPWVCNRCGHRKLYRQRH